MSTATVTGTLGADQDVTSLVLNDVTELKFDLPRKVVSVKQSTQNGKITDFDYALTATVTYTISGSTATITIA